MPTLSVIMAAYNCADTLSRAIDSIINQTYTDWEFVICDDCSVDCTERILKTYKEKYPGKFVLLKNGKNSKLAYSLNHCLKHAAGKYIARMDSDDISLPDRFDKQVSYLNEHPECAVVGTSMTRFDENGDYSIYRAVKKPDKYTLIREVPYCHATIMMRREAYEKLNGYTVSKRTERGQDLDMWFRFYAAGFAGSNLEEPLYKVFEGRDAIKRRKFKHAFYAMQIKMIGFKNLKFPVSKWIYVFSPIFSYFVPRRLKLVLREKYK